MNCHVQVSLTAGGLQVKRKILVVEDDVTTREFLRVVLEQGGYDVVLAGDGVSGVEKAASERPDLVITDGLLPRLHGFRVCKAIKESGFPTKVIILTGLYTKPTYKWEVKHQFLADDLLTKPVGADDLLAHIQNHLGPQEPSEGSGMLESWSATEMGSRREHLPYGAPEARAEMAPIEAVFSQAEMDDMFKGLASSFA
jgi:DNA-binding response OmpR family regulator